MAASTVIIEERSGRRRRVELVGGALPLQGANWSGLQLLATNWNPGNREATQHVLGPQEVPSAWDFEWNTTRINRTPVQVSDPERAVEFQIVQADTLARLLEGIFMGGALLKVTWISNARRGNTSSPRQSRIGRAETWDFNFIRPDDIEASIQFVWIGRGEEQPKASDIRGEDLLAVTQEAINAANAATDAVKKDAIVSTNRRDPSATTFSLGDLESIANGPRELVDSFARSANRISSKMRRIGELINTVKETPAAILGRLVDVANNGVAVSNQFVDQLTREGPETQATRNKVNTLTKNSAYFSNVQTQAEFMASVYERVAEAARRRRGGILPVAGDSRNQDQTRVDDTLHVHLPRPGETMLTIAQKFYGVPDLADELAVANGLPAYTIIPPKIPIIIPTRRNLEETSRNRV